MLEKISRSQNQSLKTDSVTGNTSRKTKARLLWTLILVTSRNSSCDTRLTKHVDCELIFPVVAVTVEK